MPLTHSDKQEHLLGIGVKLGFLVERCSSCKAFQTFRLLMIFA